MYFQNNIRLKYKAINITRYTSFNIFTHHLYLYTFSNTCNTQCNPVIGQSLLIKKLAKKSSTERGKERVENGMEKGCNARRGLNRGGTASWKGNIGARMELDGIVARLKVHARRTGLMTNPVPRDRFEIDSCSMRMR